jgi:hypothetical protein
MCFSFVFFEFEVILLNRKTLLVQIYRFLFLDPFFRSMSNRISLILRAIVDGNTFKGSIYVLCCSILDYFVNAIVRDLQCYFFDHQSGIPRAVMRIDVVELNGVQLSLYPGAVSEDAQNRP